MTHQYEIHKDVLLEIAFSISGEFELQKLLHNCLPVFLRKLDCRSVCVAAKINGEHRLEAVLPAHLASSPEFLREINDIGRQMARRPDVSPLEVPSENSISCAFALENFGLLILNRTRPFDHFLSNELVPLAGMLARACRSCVEVEKRRTAEEELASSKALLEATLDSIPDIIGIQNPDRTMVRYNRAGYEFLGLTPDQVKGRKCHQLIGRSTPCPDCTSARAARTASLCSTERYLPEHEKYLECISQPVLDSQGNVSLIVEQLRDITQRKMGEKELVRAKEEAEQASRVKSEFLNNVSHEIKTPLNGILSMLNILRDTYLDTRQKEYLNMAHVSADALHGIISDILDFSALESGTLSLVRKNFSVRNEIQCAASILKPRAQEKNLRFNVFIDPEIPETVKGDGLRLRQVLFNLAGNAVKFTQKGEVSISALPIKRTDSLIRIKFSIQDSGAGIPEDRQEDIFQHFTQQDSSSTRKFGGLGLGLAISKRLVQLMGGRISLDSSPGSGSEFYFELDFEQARQASAPSRDQNDSLAGSSLEQGPAQADLAGAAILLVEDNHINRRSVQIMLRDHVQKILTATNGREAVDMFQQYKFHLILMDIQMPIMDGLQAAREIRRIETLSPDRVPPVPIIALTANTDRDEQKRYFQAGMTGYLAKPVTKNELKAAIESGLNHKKAYACAGPDLGTGHSEQPEESAPVELENETAEKRTPRQVFNTRAFLERYDNNEEVAAEILSDFLEELPEHLSRLESAIDARNRDLTEKAAHKLKGSSAYAAAETISLLCRKIMNTCPEHDWKDIRQASEQLMLEAGKFRELAEKFLENDT